MNELYKNALVQVDFLITLEKKNVLFLLFLFLSNCFYAFRTSNKLFFIHFNVSNFYRFRYRRVPFRAGFGIISRKIRFNKCVRIVPSVNDRLWRIIILPGDESASYLRSCLV